MKQETRDAMRAVWSVLDGQRGRRAVWLADKTGVKLSRVRYVLARLQSKGCAYYVERWTKDEGAKCCFWYAMPLRDEKVEEMCR